MVGKAWCAEEDLALRFAVCRHGWLWSRVSREVQGRSARAVRGRWGTLAYVALPPSDFVGQWPEEPSESVVVPLPQLADPHGRSTAGGRPWDYVVWRSKHREVATTSRAPSDRQAKFVANWGLGKSDCSFLLLHVLFIGYSRAP